MTNSVEKIVDTLVDFIAYVDSFYNEKNGIYPIKGLTNSMIINATQKYITSQTKDYTLLKPLNRILSKRTCFGSSSKSNTRKKLKILPTYKVVDTCAAEFDAITP